MVDEAFVGEIDAYVDEVWDEVVEDIGKLVSINSVEDKEHAGPGMPFGPGPRAALDCALGIAERLGLSTHNGDGYIGYGDLKGKDDTTYVATIAHSDIVPLGEGWTVDPLSVTQRDGFLLGRGTADDKGPLTLSLYAAHFFARRVAKTGEALPYTLRCIVGTNEETQMEDVDYYLDHYPEPAFCFTPDAMFPLICGEKGIYGGRVLSPVLPAGEGRIVSMEGGTARNAVPGSASCVVRAKLCDLPPADSIELADAGTEDDGTPLVRISARGIGGHASMPEGTFNAIALLVSYLDECGLANEAEQGFLNFNKLLLADTAGEALGIAAKDDIFDALTCVGGTVRTLVHDGMRQFEQTFDVRYPTTTSGDVMLAQASSVAEGFGCTAQTISDMTPFYQEPDSPQIKVLVDSYNEVYGRDDAPFTIGGGTYARHFAHAAAFGPLDLKAKVPSWVGAEHGPDEGVSIEQLKRALKIYILALARLMELEF